MYFINYTYFFNLVCLNFYVRIIFHRFLSVPQMSSLSYSSKHNGVEVKDSYESSVRQSGGGASGGKSIKAMWKRFAFKATKTKVASGSLPSTVSLLHFIP